MKSVLISLIFLSVIAMNSDKPAYRIFDSKGEQSDYHELLKKVQNADIVFFGELHNNPICHWLELEITKDLYKLKKDNLILGAEMFEADNQLIINEYLNEEIKENTFEPEAKLWPNYKTDYKPLLVFAKENKLKFICTNIPRRYASIVNSKGFEGLDNLSDQAKKYITPLPVKYDAELDCYKQMLKMGQMRHVDKDYDILNLPKAQAIKDATMAYFILKHYLKGKLFLHYNGSYHSDNFEGIVWYIKQKKDLNILTITSVEQENTEVLNKIFLNKADYILCIPEDMTKTY